MILLTILKSNGNSKILPWLQGESPLAHTITGLIVSFLLVNRISSALNRYFQYRGYVSVILKDTRELVQKSIVYSRRGRHENDSPGAGDPEWRSELAYRCLLLARTTASNCEYPAAGLPAYEVPELSGPELEFCAPPSSDFMRTHEIPHNKGLASFSVPLRVAQLIRTTICSQTERLSTAFTTNHEMNLLSVVDDIVGAYTNIVNLMMTPIPFPLVQMADTITIFYVFTLPLVFLKDSPGTGHLLSDCCPIFFITYGFIGLLLVAGELDDPFGDDPNDIDVTGYAEFVLDDILIMIHDADGLKWADALRRKMNSSTQNQASLPMRCNDENETLIKRYKKDSPRLGNRVTVPDWLV